MSKKKNKSPFLLRFVQWAYPKVETISPVLAYRFFVMMFFTPLNYKTPDKEKKAETFAERFTVRVSDKKIQCYKWGNASKTIIVIHGWAGRATQFRRFLKPLHQAGYQVIGFDAPAHGQSEGRQTSLIEFELVLKKLYEIVGEPEAIITHSFGGGVALFAAMNGLPVKTLITIASPFIGDEIINTYMQALGASEKTRTYFKNEIVKRTGKPFDEFTGLHAIKNLKQPLNLLLVYDEDDKEVTLKHPNAILEIYPEAELHQTKGLGHTRILKDDQVIQRIVTYIDSKASAG